MGPQQKERNKTNLRSSWDIHRLLVLGRVPCPDFDILPVCPIGSPCTSNDPLALLTHALGPFLALLVFRGSVLDNHTPLMDC